jgi:hypothetical protein
MIDPRSVPCSVAAIQRLLASRFISMSQLKGSLVAPGATLFRVLVRGTGKQLLVLDLIAATRGRTEITVSAYAPLRDAPALLRVESALTHTMLSRVRA